MSDNALALNCWDGCAAGEDSATTNICEETISAQLSHLNRDVSLCKSSSSELFTNQYGLIAQDNSQI